MTDFIIIYKRKSGESCIKQCPNSAHAVKERLLREAEVSDPDTEVAHISAPSLESLKKSHSRYFMGEVHIADGAIGAA